MRLALLRIAAVWAVALVPLYAIAHTHSSGQVYSPSCCKGDDVGGDCKPIPDTDVEFNADASYTIKASGEKFYQPGTAPMISEPSMYNGAMITRKAKEYIYSTDGQFHRCFKVPKDPKAGTYCLYAPLPNS